MTPLCTWRPVGAFGSLRRRHSLGVCSARVAFTWTSYVLEGCYAFLSEHGAKEGVRCLTLVFRLIGISVLSFLNTYKYYLSVIYVLNTYLYINFKGGYKVFQALFQFWHLSTLYVFNINIICALVLVWPRKFSKFLMTWIKVLSAPFTVSPHHKMSIEQRFSKKNMRWKRGHGRHLFVTLSLKVRCFRFNWHWQDFILLFISLFVLYLSKFTSLLHGRGKKNNNSS